jgi:predicted transglutaminase-like cysteine proteinase
MRVRSIVAVFAAVMFIGFSQLAQAGFIGMPMQLRSAILRVQFETPTLAPMAYTQFCIRYAEDCESKPIRFRGGPVRMTDERLDQLATVNKDVNESIRPQFNYRGLAGETWVISPDRGDCNDYAVTKRHQLIEMGWPARSLLLSEVVTTSGEHHLVVVVRTNKGDLVLDNMTGSIRRWHQTPYRWVRIQMPNNSRLWATIAPRSV